MNTTNELDTVYAIYKLLSIKRVGRVLTNKIILGLQQEQTNINDVLKSKNEEILSKWLTPEQIENFFEYNEALNADIKRLVSTTQGGFLTITSESYPLSLKESLKLSAPPVISYIGNLSLLTKKSVGFCGSRNVSEKGLGVAQEMAEELSRKGIVIVSGYAKGVDQMTHYSALLSNGATIIVLPEGLENFSIKQSLKNVWDAERTLVLSEFFPKEMWTVPRAMQRNQTIIGISLAMVLIESSEKGGSMDAGKKTLAMNKKLFVAIYDDMPQKALGNQLLINQGAFQLGRSKITGKPNIEKILNNMDQPSQQVLF